MILAFNADMKLLSVIFRSQDRETEDTNIVNRCITLPRLENNKILIYSTLQQRAKPYLEVANQGPRPLS